MNSPTMTEDQVLLQDAAERYLRDNYDFNARRERLTQGVYTDPQHWQFLCRDGLAGAPCSRTPRWSGSGYPRMCDSRRALRPISCHRAIGRRTRGHHHPDCTQPLARMPGLVKWSAASSSPWRQSTKAPVGVMPPPPPHSLRSESGWRLTGAKQWVSAGPSATHFIVLASCDAGLAWILCPRDAAGVNCETFPTHDGRGGANCKFDTPVEEHHILLVGPPAQAALEAYRELAMTLSSAETLGAAHAALNTTVDYTKQRIQFGQPWRPFKRCSTAWPIC
jgi:hypothetical protein